MRTKKSPGPELMVKMRLGKASRTILVVDDDSRLRRVIRQCLDSEGYATLEAGNSQTAAGICRNHRESVDLLLTDVALPGSNGKELARRVLTYNANIKVLFMSGYMDVVNVQLSPEEFRCQFIQKPFRLAELVKKVRHILSNKM